MDLAAFIRSNEDAIVAEWQGFARTYLLSAAHMDQNSLRDHVVGLLRFIADDLETPETERERSEKAKGQGPKEGGADDSAAETHATLRYIGGFDTIEMISEFRALRASVIKLWRSEWTKTEDILPDLLRFNEAIDQVMTESLSRFTERLNYAGNLLAETLVHDFRDSLEDVRDSAKGLTMKGALDIEGVRLVSKIESSTGRLTSLVSDLIDVVGIRIGKNVPIVPAYMDIEAVIRETSGKIQAAHPSRKVQIETSGDLKGEWDRARVEQVLSNLIDNAVQHGLKTSEINITANGTDEEVILSVHNGGAFPSDFVGTIFDPLFRPGNERQIQSKTLRLDLGFLIAKAIMTSHGGSITVSSSEEKGTIFAAHFPRGKILYEDKR